MAVLDLVWYSTSAHILGYPARTGLNIVPDSGRVGMLWRTSLCVPKAYGCTYT